jgi:hypothetical protein
MSNQGWKHFPHVADLVMIVLFSGFATHPGYLLRLDRPQQGNK